MPRYKTEAQLERDFQAHLIRRLKDDFPGCIVLKNDSSYLQGIPDLTVLHGERWAALEVKANASSEQQPNQEYYVEMMNAMSFAAFIHPENEEEVFDGLEQALCNLGPARVSKR